MFPEPPNRFRWLATVDESFVAMQVAIQAAQRSVRLESYIYSDCYIGRQFRDMLVQAARRGARVDVLIDAFGSMELPESFWEPLVQAGGEFRWFNPLSLKRLVFRNHRKLLVCDESVAFVGGFNIATEYEGDGVTRGWHDFGVEVRGDLAAHLAVTFDTLFSLADFQHKRFTALRSSPFQDIMRTPDGQVLLSAPGRGKNFLKQSLMRDLARAKSVKIISGYFLPTIAVRRALIRLARRGASVDLLLAGKTDVPLAMLASRYFYNGFLKAGVRIHEYEPQILHAKIFLIDDVVYVGSANLDRRSFYINYELVLRLRDRRLAAEAAGSFEKSLSVSRRIVPRRYRGSRSLWTRLKERWAFFILGQLDPLVARRQLKMLR